MNLAGSWRHGTAVFDWCAGTLPVSAGKTAGPLLTISRDPWWVDGGASACTLPGTSRRHLSWHSLCSRIQRVSRGPAVWRRLMKLRTGRWRFRVGLGLPLVFLALQLVPYGRDHVNPSKVSEPAWDSPATRALAKQACFDCHSNETEWPAYARIAPASWLVQHDVEEGRAVLNFSEWQRRRILRHPVFLFSGKENHSGQG